MIALGDHVRGRWPHRRPVWPLGVADPGRRSAERTACDVADYRSGTNRRRKSRSRLAPRRRDHTFNIPLRICEGFALARGERILAPTPPGAAVRMEMLARPNCKLTGDSTATQNVSFWHKADIAAVPNDVRFWG